MLTHIVKQYFVNLSIFKLKSNLFITLVQYLTVGYHLEIIFHRK